MIDKTLKTYIDENPKDKFSIIVTLLSKVRLKDKKIKSIQTPQNEVFENLVNDIQKIFKTKKEMNVLKIVKSIIIEEVSRAQIYKIAELENIDIRFNKKISAI